MKHTLFTNTTICISYLFLILQCNTEKCVCDGLSQWFAIMCGLESTDNEGIDQKFLFLILSLLLMLISKCIEALFNKAHIGTLNFGPAFGFDP